MSIAVSDFKIELSIATPSSVKAKVLYRVPPLFVVTICDLKLDTSCGVISNIKSEGNRLMLRLTDCFSTFVSSGSFRAFRVFRC